MSNSRSIWKGPYLSWSLLRHWLKSQNLKKIENRDLKKKSISFSLKNPNFKTTCKKEKLKTKVFRTWSRSSTILPSFVGSTFEIHNGKTFVKLVVTKEMIGHKFGEFSLTRKSGSKIKKKKK